MKNKLMNTTIGVFLALLAILGMTQISVSAQEKEADSYQEPFGRSNRSIEGVWQTIITQRNCQTGEAVRSFRGLLTFNDHGTINETSAVTSPALRSPGHGVWEKESRTTFSGSFMFLRFNADGSFAGSQKVTQTFIVGGRGNTFEANGTIQVFDVNDNIVGTGCATATGARFE